MIKLPNRRLFLDRKLIGIGEAAAQRYRGDRQEKHSGQFNPPVFVLPPIRANSDHL
jgi:hypothetical protein